MYSDFILILYIVHELNTWQPNPTNNLTRKNCFFCRGQLTRNGDKSKFTYNHRRIAFDGQGFQSFHNDTNKNIVIFGVINSGNNNSS